VESLALSILRLVEEESMKERTGRVVAQLPVDVATFLLNEKRAVIAEVEERYSVQITLVPNETLESPRFEITRIRVDHLSIDQNSAVSYELNQDFDAEGRENATLTRPLANAPALNPAVRSILPPAAAATAPAPAPEPVPLLQPVAPRGFWAWLSGLFRRRAEPAQAAGGALPTPRVRYPAPVVVRNEAAARTGGARAQRNPRQRQDRDRPQRAEGRGGGNARGGAGTRDRNEQRPPRTDRQERAERPERGDRQERPERPDRPPRQERAPRAERPPQPATERTERPPARPPQEIPAQQELDAEGPEPGNEALPLSAGEGAENGSGAPSEGQREGAGRRRRGRRGGRGRSRGNENGGEPRSAQQAGPGNGGNGDANGNSNGNGADRSAAAALDEHDHEEDDFFLHEEAAPRPASPVVAPIPEPEHRHESEQRHEPEHRHEPDPRQENRLHAAEVEAAPAAPAHREPAPVAAAPPPAPAPVPAPRSVEAEPSHPADSEHSPSAPSDSSIY
jgi:ribonuclease E